MIQKKQIILIVAVLAIMGALIAQPIKGLVDKTQGEADATAAAQGADVAEDLLSISEAFKSGINSDLANSITSLEEQLEKAGNDEEKSSILLEIAEKWGDLNKFAPQAFAYEEIAEISPTYENWMRAGKTFQEGYQRIRDEELSVTLQDKAIYAFGKALEEDEKSLDAQTGLGSAILNKGEAPMEGVTLLLGVVKEEPKHLEANKALGLSSLTSRQYDKAVERFLIVLEQEESAESYFYLATAYENIGMKNEAITAFLKSKRIASDPTLSQFIDRRIEELNKM